MDDDDHDNDNDGNYGLVYGYGRLCTVVVQIMEIVQILAMIRL